MVIIKLEHIASSYCSNKVELLLHLWEHYKLPICKHSKMKKNLHFEITLKPAKAFIWGGGQDSLPGGSDGIMCV